MYKSTELLKYFAKGFPLLASHQTIWHPLNKQIRDALVEYTARNPILSKDKQWFPKGKQNARLNLIPRGWEYDALPDFLLIRSSLFRNTSTALELRKAKYYASSAVFRQCQHLAQRKR